MAQINIPAKPTQSEALRTKTNGKDDAQDLERVRDILFGSQLLGIEERFRALEGDLKGKLATAREESQKDREEIQKESKALESRLQKTTDSLKGELDSEKKERTKALEELSKTTRESVKEIDKRFTDITDQMEVEKVDRTELSKVFRQVSSELGDGSETSQKVKKPIKTGKLQFDQVP